jgi:7-cyano-7-deazaguanine synthase
MAVVLLSGGLDSAVALACAKQAGFACRTLTFSYGQRHHAELVAAQNVAESLGVVPEHRCVLSIDLNTLGGSALTSASIDVPKCHQHPGGAATTGPRVGAVPVTYVPARNLIFLSCAAAFAETLGATDLFAGMNAVDYSGYPDCREPFIRAFESAVTLGTKIGVEQPLARWRVHTPLIHWSKAEIIREGVRLGVNFALTHSCYDPMLAPDGSWLACGACESCRIRRQGFIDAGVADPTRYAPAMS